MAYMCIREGWRRGGGGVGGDKRRTVILTLKHLFAVVVALALVVVYEIN